VRDPSVRSAFHHGQAKSSTLPPNRPTGLPVCPRTANPPSIDCGQRGRHPLRRGRCFLPWIRGAVQTVAWRWRACMSTFRMPAREVFLVGW